MKNIKYIHPTIATIPITPNRLLAGSEAGITKDKNIETNAPLTGGASNSYAKQEEFGEWEEEIE